MRLDSGVEGLDRLGERTPPIPSTIPLISSQADRYCGVCVCVCVCVYVCVRVCVFAKTGKFTLSLLRVCAHVCMYVCVSRDHNVPRCVL